MSKRLKELQQKQHDLKQEAVALLDKADAEQNGVLTKEQEDRYSASDAELKTLAADIEREQANVNRRLSLEAIRTAAPTAPAAPTIPGASRSPARHNEVRDLNPALTGGFANLAEMAVAVRDACVPGGQVDQRLLPLSVRPGAAPTNYMEGGGSSGEGFNLPVQYREEIWQLVFDLDDIFTTTDLEPTSARQVDVTKDETTPWGATGVQAYWRSEAGQMTASKMATKGESMALHELYAFVLASEELLEDAPRLANRMSVKAAQAINWKINDSVIYGAGAGKPKGWFVSDALVSVAKEAGQAADTIVAKNVLNMFARLLVAPGDQPYWLANRDTVPQLATMTIGDNPVWLPPNGLIAAPGGILLGYPVRFSEHGKTLGDKGDIQLVSPKGYYAARRTDGVQFASSIHLYFDYNIQAFRWTFRFGGQPHLSAPVSPANGSNTKSHFVTLDART